jgi:hypothetical protein
MHSHRTFGQNSSPLPERSLWLALCLAQMVSLTPALAVAPKPADKPAAKTVAKPAEKGDAADDTRAEATQKNLTAPVLATLAKEYKDSPDDVSWTKYFTYLRDLLASGDFAQAGAAEMIAANPSLSELHVKIFDAGAKNARLWTFPSVNECHGVIFSAPGKVTFIPLPLSIVLREGRIVPSTFVGPAVKPVAVRGKHALAQVTAKHGASAASRAHVARESGAEATGGAAIYAAGKFLVLIGGDRQSNNLWFKGFKLVEGPLVEAPELFASLPMFFSQNVTGKASFSGSDIVLTVQPPATPTAKDETEKVDVVIQSNGKPMAAKPVPTSIAGYKVVLKYMGGKFGLAGKLPDDAPLSVAMSFCQNVLAGRADMAKAWLADPKLISIPKYLALIGKNTIAMRLIPMSAGSGSRYRMVTSAKNDLIIDVGRVLTPGKLKGQLAVKGLFIAPADPYAAKLTGTVVSPQAADKPAGDVSDTTDSGTKNVKTPPVGKPGPAR